MVLRTTKLEEVARISPRLARKYSATQCLGPAAVSDYLFDVDLVKFYPKDFMKINTILSSTDASE
jgi:hypothetical protein